MVNGVLELLEPAHAALARAFARHRVHAKLCRKVVDVLLLLHELHAVVFERRLVVPAARGGAVGDVHQAAGAFRAGRRIGMLRRSLPVEIRVDLGNVGLVLRDPAVERLDVAGVLHDRFGIAKIRKIDRVAVRVGELTLKHIDLVLVGLRIAVGGGDRVHQRLAVVAAGLQQLGDQIHDRMVLIRGEQGVDLHLFGLRHRQRRRCICRRLRLRLGRVRGVHHHLVGGALHRLAPVDQLLGRTTAHW